MKYQVINGNIVKVNESDICTLINKANVEYDQ